MPIIKWNLATRLAVPAAAGGLLLLALAYWWQSNLVHEVAGTLMFGFVIRHIYTNRQWFLGLFRGRYDARRRLVASFYLLLAVNMVLLLATSFAISQSVFFFLPIPDNVTMRDLHWVSAYWLVMTVGVHLGLHWSRVMKITIVLSNIDGQCLPQVGPSRRRLCHRGPWRMELQRDRARHKAHMELQSRFLGFSLSVAPFFAHWAGVMALPAILTHYAVSVALPGRGPKAREEALLM